MIFVIFSHNETAGLRMREWRKNKIKKEVKQIPECAVATLYENRLHDVRGQRSLPSLSFLLFAVRLNNINQ